MTMLVPLGVLALGAVFAGMIWFNSFFGEHDDVNAFYGVPTHAEAEAGHADRRGATRPRPTRGHADHR